MLTGEILPADAAAGADTPVRSLAPRFGVGIRDLLEPDGEQPVDSSTRPSTLGARTAVLKCERDDGFFIVRQVPQIAG